MWLSRTFTVFVLLFTIVFQTETLRAQSTSKPSQDPILRIETGMHTAIIRRIGVDRDCRLLVTGSDDKTIRLWSVPDGKLLRTIRLAVGKGHEGKIFATTMSADGRLIAAGGWDAQWPIDRSMRVYIIDAVTGEILQRLGGLPGVINHLTFSKDGRYLATVLHSGKGMVVWDTGTWEVAGRDRDYQAGSFSAVFDNEGRLYTTSWDGHLRQYNRNFKLIRKVKVRNGERPFGVNVDPSGRNIAVGFDDKSQVDIYEAESLRYKYSPDLNGVRNGSLVAVTWSRDGETLYAGGTYFRNGQRPLLMWNEGGRGPLRIADGPISSLMHLVPCREEMGLGSGDPSFGLLTKAGQRILWKNAVKADMRGKLGSHFTVSDNGTRLRFGLGYAGQRPVMFDLTTGKITEAPRSVSDLYESDTGSLEITEWKDSYKPRLNGKVLPLISHEKSSSVSIRPNGKGFVLGGYWSLRYFSDQGRQLWSITPPFNVWGVNITGNGKLVVASLGDGTIRWFRLTDGKELLALFVHTGKNLRWVAWTPKGYYTASPGGEDLIGWHINRNWNETADFFPGSRFRDRFYRPDIIQLVLKLVDENRAIREANRVAKRNDGNEDILKRLPPVIKILGPDTDTEFRSKEIKLKYSLRSPSGLDISQVDVLLDGRPLPEQQLTGLKLTAEGKIGEITIPLPERDVEVALIARTSRAVSQPTRVALKWAGAPPKPKTPEFAKPVLYALLIGVSNYQNSDYRLRYAAKDARDLSEALMLQQGGVYRQVVTKILTDKDATAGNIRDGLEWLESEVTHRDVGLLFLAGHGITDLKQRFYYLPFDGDPKRLRRTAIPQSAIQDAISTLPGKVLMFIDACHSAGGLRTTTQTRGLSLLDVTAVVNELSSAENGVVMFASSTGRELSIEDDRWQNGAFTEALLEGLAGMADYSKDRVVSIGELDLWLSERVKILTDKQQHPVARRPDTVPDFPFAIHQQ